MSNRRTSLTQELQGREANYVHTRLNDVLNTMPAGDRNTVLAEYTQKTANIGDKPFVLAGLLDSWFERKKQPQHAHHHSVPLPVKPQVSAPMRARSQTIGSISGPEPLDECYVQSDKQVADYVFIKTLGKGTFGKVKLAEHVITKQKVAIKVIEKANIKTPKQRTSVDREVRLVKLLHHPHIVGVIDVFETKDHIWIIMEHASGGELFDHIVKNGLIKEPEARRFFRQIVSAVEYCHMNSIIHRDLKPENLLLDDQLNIKVIDFGFGNTYHRERYLETFCGSPFYAAPEMLQGVRYIGPEVDIWSMGVILYALLSGRLPFDAANMNELYGKIGRGKYSCPSHFSAEAVHLISRMLTVDPKKRATLSEIRHHVWVNQSYNQMVPNYLRPRPLTVESPQKRSLSELVSYGFKEEEAARILRQEPNPHPIVSLYHLIDEARQRKEERERVEQSATQEALCDLAQSERTNSLATIGTHSSEGMVPVGPMAYTVLLPVPIAIPPPPPQSRLNFNAYFQKLAYGRKTPQAEATISQPPDLNAMNVGGGVVPRRMPTPATGTTPVVAYGNSCSYPGASPHPPRPMTSIPTRKQSSTETTETSTAEEYDDAAEDKDLEGQRQVRGFFNIQTSSTRRSDEICCEIDRCLRLNGITFEKTNRFLYVCEDRGNRFEIEVCRHLPPGSPSSADGRETPATIHDIYLRRLRGNVWTHKRICGKLIEQMRL